MPILLKFGGQRCVTYFRGVPKCVTGEGSQNWSK